jgi:hypothetical protein
MVVHILLVLAPQHVLEFLESDLVLPELILQMMRPVRGRPEPPPQQPPKEKY